MIDIHSHIIPNIDDGSKSIEETVELIKEANRNGFSDIILTPHYMLNEYEPTPEGIKSLKNKLQKIMNKEGIDVNLFTGMEIYITNELSTLFKNGKILTLADSKYLLIELPLNTNVQYLDMIIFQLTEKNIIPIIAHPERYKFVQQKPNIVKEFIEKGCLIQSNYGSILGIYGSKSKKAIKYLLKNDLVHFLATDVHRQNTIYPKIEKAIQKIKKIVGKEKLKKLIKENAADIIKNN